MTEMRFENRGGGVADDDAFLSFFDLMATDCAQGEKKIRHDVEEKIAAIQRQIKELRRKLDAELADIADKFYPVSRFHLPSKSVLDRDCWALFKQRHPGLPNLGDVPTHGQMKEAQADCMDIVIMKAKLHFLNEDPARIEAVVDYMKRKILGLRRSGARRSASRLSRILAVLGIPMGPEMGPIDAGETDDATTGGPSGGVQADPTPEQEIGGNGGGPRPTTRQSKRRHLGQA